MSATKDRKTRKNTQKRPNAAFIESQRHGRSDEEFAGFLGVNKRTLKRMLQGELGTRDKTYRDVAKRIGCHVEDVYIMDDTSPVAGQSFKPMPLALLRVHPQFNYDPINEKNFDLERRRCLTDEFVTLADRCIKMHGGEFNWNQVGLEINGVFRVGTRSERALAAERAAFSIIRGAQQSKTLTPAAGWLLAPRCGIHLDDSSCGSLERIDTVAPYIARCLQEAADPYGILVSKKTYRSLRDVTDKLILPVSEPIPLRYEKSHEPSKKYEIRPYRVIDQPAGRSDIDLFLHPEQLRQLSDAVKRGGWGVHFVYLHSPEGYGKTKVLEELERVSTSPSRQVARVECLASAVPLQTATRLILQVLQLTDLSTEDDLESMLKRHCPASYKETFEVLGPLLFEGRIEPRRNHEKIFTVLANILRQVRLTKKLVLIVDDAQLCDAMSLEFFMKLAGQKDFGQIPIVFAGLDLATALAPLVPSEQVSLERWGDVEARQFATRLVESRVGCGVSVDEVVQRGEGVPSQLVLAFNELLFGVPVQDDTTERPADVPITLIASNEPALAVLVIATIFGDRFDFELMRKVWRQLNRDKKDLEQALDVLAKSRLMEVRKVRRRRECRLAVRSMAHQAVKKHYQLDRQAWKAIQIACAQVLTKVRPGTHPVDIAKLYEDGGDHLEAIRWWHRAGEFCLGTDAEACHQAALENFSRAEDLLNNQDRLSLDEKRLKLQVLIGIIQAHARERYASDGIENAIRAAELLYPEVDDPVLSYKVIRAKWSKCHNMGDFPQALRCIEELDRVVQETDLIRRLPHGGRGALIEVDHAAAVTYFAMGDLVKAIEHQKKAIKWMAGDFEFHPCCLEYSDHDPIACCLINGAICNLLLGKFRAANTSLKRARSRLGDGRNVGTKMVIECFSALFHIFKADLPKFADQSQALLQEALKNATEAEQLAGVNQVAHWHGMATIMKSICQARFAVSAAELQSAIKATRSGIELWSQRGQRTLVPLWLSYLSIALMDLSVRYEVMAKKVASQKAMKQAEKHLRTASNQIAETDIAQYFVESATAELFRLQKDRRGYREWNAKAKETLQQQQLLAFQPTEVPARPRRKR